MREPNRVRWIQGAGGIILTALGIAVPQMAASDPSGQLIAAVCANCHGSEGRSAGAIPSLDSLSAEAIGQNLAAFRSGAGEATVMSRIAKGFDDAEIAALVAYFAARGQ